MSDGTSTSTADITALPASALIEAFGGVRPLAKKLDLAASTVQGWKLRDHIPESYHHRLQNLIQEESLDVTNIAGTEISTETKTPVQPATTPPAVAPAVAAAVPPRESKPASRPVPTDPNHHYFSMPQSTMRYWVMSSLATIGLLTLVIVMLMVVFFGKDLFDYAAHEDAPAAQVTADQDVDTTPTTPEPTRSSEQAVQANLQQSRDAIDETLNSVKKIKDETSPDQTALVEQIDRIETIVSGLRDRVDTLDKTLQEKGVDAGAIRQQMSEISRRDVIAAALLLGVAQLHGMMDQQADFTQDLAFLKALMANDPEMIKSLDKLAPFAETGLMTQDQIMETLNMIGKETVKISQDNPKLTWSQKLMAAFGNVIEIRKKDAAQAKAINTDTPHGQIEQAKVLVADDQYAMAAQILQSYQGPQAAQVMDIARNLQGRDAASQVLNNLLEKSQNLLSIDQLKALMNQPTSSPSSAPAAVY